MHEPACGVSSAQRRLPGLYLYLYFEYFHRLVCSLGPQGRINKPAKSGDLFYSEPIAVIYLFESLFPRLIRTQIYSRI